MTGREASAARRHNPNFADWFASAVVGGLATIPWTLAVVGWVSHWNSYTNLTLTLVGFVYWAVIYTAWRHDG